MLSASELSAAEGAIAFEGEGVFLDGKTGRSVVLQPSCVVLRLCTCVWRRAARSAQKTNAEKHRSMWFHRPGARNFQPAGRQA